jgi:microcystin-dependent protein
MSKFQSISLPTLSDSATMKEVENESRKMGLDILNKLNTVDSNATNATTVGGLSATVLAPIGSITMFGGATVPPSGWLTCDGSAVNRTTYSALFAVISTTWGAGDGSTTFNLPDMRGAAPAGVGTSTGYTQNETLVLGTKYNDQFQGHWHESRYATAAPITGAGYPGTNAGTGGMTPTNVTNVQVASTDGTNGTPRTGAITRGKRIGVNFIIKY